MENNMSNSENTTMEHDHENNTENIVASNRNSISPPSSPRRSEDAAAANDSEGTTFIEAKPEEDALPNAPWTPGIWPRLPWIAILSILTSLCAAGCMILITIKANNSNVSSWAVSPPVLLAIASTLANTLIHVALDRGAAVTWWFLSMHPKRQTRVKDFHWRWAAAEGLVDALESIFTRGFSKTAVACSFATIVAINSPLLQRTLTVKTQESFTGGVTAGPVYAAPLLPIGFGAFVGDRNLRITNPTDQFSLLLAEYNSRSPMILPGEANIVGLNKTLRTTIQAAGYHVNCTLGPTIRLPSFDQVDETQGGSGITQYTDNLTDIFVSSVSYLEDYGYTGDLKILGSIILDPLRDFRDESSSINDKKPPGRVFWYDTIWKAESGCINQTNGAELKVRQCDIRPAIVKYPVLINSNNSITLLPLLEADSFSDEVLPNSIETREQAVNETERANWQRSTHGGLALFLNNRFSSNYTVKGDSFLLDMGYWGSYVTGYYPYELLRTGESRCDRWFRDPGPAVFEAIREIGLRSALMSANSSEPSHKLQLSGETAETIAIYTANYGFLYGAVTITILAALSVIPLFYGFWKLGREVSLSPLETAKAFRPLQLEGAPSNSTVQGLLKRVGTRPIKYGIITTTSEENTAVLGMDDPNNIIHPDEFQKDN